MRRMRRGGDRPFFDGGGREKIQIFRFLQDSDLQILQHVYKS